ncbi:hypothetical protein [Halorhabdus sp. CUG00001]|nr:hypothetical protein [Halorhabdus sp. CUG00001]
MTRQTGGVRIDERLTSLRADPDGHAPAGEGWGADSLFVDGPPIVKW